MALSDPTRTVARPLSVLRHRSRAADAEAISDLAGQHQVGLILVGLPLDQHGNIGPQARRALRLVEALRQATRLPVDTWDEPIPPGRRRIDAGSEELGARAAAVILQDFLDAAVGMPAQRWCWWRGGLRVAGGIGRRASASRGRPCWANHLPTWTRCPGPG
jgi:putative Holliday junction resolvase